MYLLELERLRYLLASYLRTRLKKVTAGTRLLAGCTAALRLFPGRIPWVLTGCTGAPMRSCCA